MKIMVDYHDSYDLFHIGYKISLTPILEPIIIFQFCLKLDPKYIFIYIVLYVQKKKTTFFEADC